jgi:hypothetical protein
MENDAVPCAQTAIVDKDIQKVGAPGQAKKNMWGTFFLPAVLLLADCANPETIFSGPTTPLAGTCDPPTAAVLTLRHHAVAFAPDTGTLVLRGTTDPSGHITASLTLPGVDHKPYALILDATRHADVIEGTYVTPRCRYHIALRGTAG